MMKIVAIGDPHFKIDNIQETDLFSERIVHLCEDHAPDLIVVLGDLLHTHERLHTTAMNRCTRLIDRLRQIALTYVIVGNHDALSNRVYMDPEGHWMNAMKKWDNVVIVDKVEIFTTEDEKKLYFVPYVYPGRFAEALGTSGDDWKDAHVIFAHQEFAGCKMGAIISVEGDIWPRDYPHVVSGHIHSRQKPQDNIYYPGASLQHAFGESEKNIIPVITLTEEGYDLEEIDLGLPRKKIVYMGVEDVDTYTTPEGADDKIKVTVSGGYEEFKALKKTKKYKDLTDKGVKVVFKPRKIEADKELAENVRNFEDILSTIVNNEKNPYLVQAYDYVVNGKETNIEDVLFV